MSQDDGWLTTLLGRWTALAPEVRGQLQIYLQLAPGDRKNRRRLEKKLKMAADQAETVHPEAAGRKAPF